MNHVSLVIHVALDLFVKQVRMYVDVMDKWENLVTPLVHVRMA
jgi:hypothetical protein